MKKILTYITFCLALAVSCNKAELDQNAAGTGVLSMEMKLSEQTKAMTADELLAGASVKIYKADFSGLVRSYSYSTMPNPFYLAVDTYRVDVEAGEATKENPSAASWTDRSSQSQMVMLPMLRLWPESTMQSQISHSTAQLQRTSRRVTP